MSLPSDAAHPDMPHPPDWQAELAHERNRIAADRTLLAWIRISTLLISLGVGIDQAVGIVYVHWNSDINPSRLSHWLGLAFVGLGTLTVMWAAIDHQAEVHRLSQPDYFYTPRPPLGTFVGLALLLIGLGSFGVIATVAH